MSNYLDIIATAKLDMSTVPGGWEPKLDQLPAFTRKPNMTYSALGAEVRNGALTPPECRDLIDFMRRSPNKEAVSVYGLKDSPTDQIGSIRTTVWSPEIAQFLWSKLSNYIGSQYFGADSLTDWWQNDKERHWWQPIGVTPILRFMEYSKGGQHFPHYDSGFIYPNDSYRTLKSLIVYLTSNDGASTRFINDKQEGPVWTRRHDDWNRAASSEEVIAESQAIQGNMLFFNHRICHDVELYSNTEPRIIIRADILYRNVHGK